MRNAARRQIASVGMNKLLQPDSGLPGKIGQFEQKARAASLRPLPAQECGKPQRYRDQVNRGRFGCSKELEIRSDIRIPAAGAGEGLCEVDGGGCRVRGAHATVGKESIGSIECEIRRHLDRSILGIFQVVTVLVVLYADEPSAGRKGERSRKVRVGKAFSVSGTPGGYSRLYLQGVSGKVVNADEMRIVESRLAAAADFDAERSNAEGRAIREIEAGNVVIGICFWTAVCEAGDRRNHGCGPQWSQ
jgi:hypothetical protein